MQVTWDVAMAVLSISEASRRWRMGRTTIQKAIREGRLSATGQPNGSKGIDTAELLRAFGEPPADAWSDAGTDAPQPPTTMQAIQADAPASSQADAGLAVSSLQAQVTLLQAQLDDAKERELWLRRQLEDTRRLLPAPPPAPVRQPPPPRLWALLILLAVALALAAWRWWPAIDGLIRGTAGQ